MHVEIPPQTGAQPVTIGAVAGDTAGYVRWSVLFLAALGGGGGGGGLGADWRLMSAECRPPVSTASADHSRSTSYLPVPRYGSAECSWMVARRQLHGKWALDSAHG